MVISFTVMWWLTDADQNRTDNTKNKNAKTDEKYPDQSRPDRINKQVEIREARQMRPDESRLPASNPTRLCTLDFSSKSEQTRTA